MSTTALLKGRAGRKVRRQVRSMAVNARWANATIKFIVATGAQILQAEPFNFTEAQSAEWAKAVIQKCNSNVTEWRSDREQTEIKRKGSNKYQRPNYKGQNMR